MRAFIDTNIFVYASHSQFKEHTKALNFLKNCHNNKNLWYLSWKVIYEYLRVVTHTQLFPKGSLSLEEALENIQKFLDSPQVSIIKETDSHLDYLYKISQQTRHLKGNLLHDVHHVSLMMEHDITTIYSADTDFHRFKEIEVVNPVL